MLQLGCGIAWDCKDFSALQRGRGRNCRNQAITLLDPRSAKKNGLLSVMAIFRQLTGHLSFRIADNAELTQRQGMQCAALCRMLEDLVHRRARTERQGLRAARRFPWLNIWLFRRKQCE
jgi:hypothetical protein